MGKAEGLGSVCLAQRRESVMASGPPAPHAEPVPLALDEQGEECAPVTFKLPEDKTLPPPCS